MDDEMTQDEAVVAADFMLRYLTARERGEAQDLSAWQRRYPGHEALIAAEHARLTSRPEERAGDSETDLELDELIGAVSPPSILEKEHRFGRWVLEAELGRGGQATVYRAFDPDLDRVVALKVLRSTWAGSADMVRRIRLESRLLSALDHPGICRVFDAGVHEGIAWIAMSLVEGSTLRAWRSQRAETRTPLARPEDIADAVRLVADVAHALHAAHEAGIVHRDVKPGNVVIGSDGRPVILDFGLARELDGMGVTRTGDVLGTPGYMAPEQVRGAGHRADARTDVYALGVVLYELVTGRKPFEASGRAALDEQILHAEAPRLRSVAPRASRQLEIVVAAALRKTIDRRYASARAFAEDLERLARGEPVLARAPGLARRLATFVKRRPAVAALLVVPPVVLAVGLGGALARGAAIDEIEGDLLREKEAAERARVEADERAAAYGRLQDLAIVQLLDRRQRDAWPANAARIAELESWLETAREVVARLPAHRRDLDELRRSGVRDPRRTRDERLAADHRKWTRAHESLQASLADAGLNPLAVEQWKAAEDVVRKYREEMDRLVAERSAWVFARPTDQWRHDRLEDLVRGLEFLEDGAAEGSIAEVTARLDRARTLTERTVHAHAEAWRRATERVAADDRYGGLEVAPIPGFVPLGPDPVTGFQEFAHVGSGAPAARGSDGVLDITEETGLVFVLIPGGSATVGAEASGPDGAPNVDPLAEPREGPVHVVELSAFLISKYEMTQAQWLRLTGREPSSYARVRVTAVGGRDPSRLQPVETVTWTECVTLLRKWGLTLPTEVQWEYAARGGKPTPWWTGPTESTVRADAENLADATLKARGGVAEWKYDEDRDDGWSGPAPVGTFAANPYGLHDVLGNVSEWCLDAVSSYRDAARAGDGLRRLANARDLRRVRGGHFHDRMRDARVSARGSLSSDTGRHNTGVRPARSLEP